MNGIHLRLYTYENRRIHGELSYEWLLEKARGLGIHGGSAFRAIAGFGRHGRIHEQSFFELAGEVPVLVEFLLDEEQCGHLLALLKDEDMPLFYTRTPVTFGVVGNADA
ncbi:MAG: DUF190 domain-containing protein [Rhodanobacteraceae bacterium]|nr:DUF190 domain-containing protein [Xanthomonadales bacterium]MCP5477970.1 DUF190 domain-containing protein [Rhodanobacteraceae bacterium]HPF73194.1 DUF190 domain-containing protein [Xanthomonadaceae bacterium]HRX98630.1 DUF190 domain-containing protein [Xanthomonadaceae bacterium]